jgi:YD repeat-containing protein
LKIFINYTATVQTTHDLYGCPLISIPVLQSEVSEFGGTFFRELRPPRLKRIDFKGGHVDFEYAISSNNVTNNLQTWDLQKIKIYNRLQTVPLQTISLSKSKFANGEQRLDKVSFTNSQMQHYDYQFGYKELYSSVSTGAGIDYWGYYNGNSVPYKKRYVPKFFNMDKIMNNYTTDRSVSEHVMQEGVLNKIIYPTKGYSTFTYEAHRGKYSLGSDIKVCGGLRIKEIRNYLSDGNLAGKKWYKYGENESGAGIVNTDVDINDFLTNFRTFNSYITNYGNYTPCTLIRTAQYLSSPKRNYFISGSSVVYSQVTEYTGDEKDDYGKTIYRYYVTADEFLPSQSTTYRFKSPDVSLRTYPWKTGKLISKSSYKKEGNTYIPVYSLYNQYKVINTAEYRNLRVRPYATFATYPEYLSSSGPSVLKDFCRYESFRQYFDGNSPYDYFNYYTTTGLQVLSYSEETIDGVTKITDYDSYNKIGLPTKIRETTSAGSTLAFIYKYPADFTSAVYAGMQSNNILTPVIEKTTYKDDNQLLEKEIRNYKLWHSKFYAPENKQIQYQNNYPETRLKYDYGTKGNIVATIKDDSDKTVYLWGYNHQYPIAEIKGVTYAEVKNLLSETLINNLAASPNSNVADLDTRLRNGFKDKMVWTTTYTYKPLVGMTSKTDPNGVTTYYEYDEFNRLKTVRNHEGNVLQQYEYHYAGQ